MWVLSFVTYSHAMVPGMYETEACVCPKPGTEPQDPDEPPDASLCYDPLCPAGYYLCCYECDMATCAGNMPMILSRRGKRECIQCGPGDFCKGCDLFEECPIKGSTVDENTGEVVLPKNPSYMVTVPGAQSTDDCMECASDHEASYDRSQCISSFRNECNEKYMRRCMANCSETSTECERMKCAVYCAKQWSKGCLDRYGLICYYYLNPPSVNPMVMMVQEDTGFEMAKPTTTTTTTTMVDCDVVCDSAWTPSVKHILSFQLLFLLVNA